MKTVLVSGATGYLALHIIKQLIDAQYGVVAIVRSKTKGDDLLAKFGSPHLKYEVVPDITVANAYDEAVKNHPEATVFLHTASPMIVAADDLMRDIFNPAVEGTRNALLAVHKCGPQITRFVVTSSFAAHARLETVFDPSKTIVEDSCANYTLEECTSKDLPPAMAGLIVYCGAKDIAEKLAWDYAKENNTNFAVTSIGTVTLLGPQVFPVKGTLNLSAEIVNGLLSLKKDDTLAFDYKGGFIDVRDCARAHIVAFESEKAKGQRLMLSSQVISSQGILDIIHDKFPEVAKDMPLLNPGGMQNDIKSYCTIDNSKTNAILGFKLRTLEESVVDVVRQSIEVNQ